MRFLEDDLTRAALQRLEVLHLGFDVDLQAARERDQLGRRCDRRLKVALHHGAQAIIRRGEFRHPVLDHRSEVGLIHHFAVELDPVLPFLRQREGVVDTVLAPAGRVGVGLVAGL